MTIKTIYKVVGDINEYDSEQEAQIAEAIQENNALYVRDYDKLAIAKAITKRYFLCPIIPTTTIQEFAEEQKDTMAELDSWGASA